jgi:hypothetical protein
MTGHAREPATPQVAGDEKHRSPWIWVSAVLAIVAVGLGIWAFTLKSDRDETKQELDTTKQ